MVVVLLALELAALVLVTPHTHPIGPRLPRQEVELFRAWYSDVEETKAAQAAALAAAAEEDAVVGPTLPGAPKPGGGAGGNYGGFLLPGEGDRWGRAGRGAGRGKGKRRCPGPHLGVGRAG